MKVRWATQQDAPEIQRLIQAAYEEHGFSWEEEGYHSDLYDLEGAYLSGKGGFWVAEDDEGSILATAGLSVHEPLGGEAGSLSPDLDGLMFFAGADCELVRMYAWPEARGIGAGKLLFRKAVTEAKRQGCCLMQIWSDKSLVRGHAFYERQGAERKGERIDASPDRAEEWGFLLRLDEVRKQEEE